MYAFDRSTCSQIRFRIAAEVDEDKLTTRITMCFDGVTDVTIVEGEDLCIDFYYKSYSSEPVFDQERGCSYQVFWSKGSDNDLTYDQMDQGVKAGGYKLKIGDRMFHELKEMQLEDEPEIMR